MINNCVLTACVVGDFEMLSCILSAHDVFTVMF